MGLARLKYIVPHTCNFASLVVSGGVAFPSKCMPGNLLAPRCLIEEGGGEGGFPHSSTSADDNDNDNDDNDNNDNDNDGRNWETGAVRWLFMKIRYRESAPGRE